MLHDFKEFVERTTVVNQMFHELTNAEDLSEKQVEEIRYKYNSKGSETITHRESSKNDGKQESKKNSVEPKKKCKKILPKDIKINTDSVLDENLRTEIDSYFQGLCKFRDFVHLSVLLIKFISCSFSTEHRAH